MSRNTSLFAVCRNHIQLFKMTTRMLLLALALFVVASCNAARWRPTGTTLSRSIKSLTGSSYTSLSFHDRIRASVMTLPLRWSSSATPRCW